jgi:hypothetical protein
VEKLFAGRRWENLSGTGLPRFRGQSDAGVTAASASRLPHFLPDGDISRFSDKFWSHHMSVPVTSQPQHTASYPNIQQQQQQQQQPLQEKKKMSAWVWVVGLGATAFFVRLPDHTPFSQTYSHTR